MELRKTQNSLAVIEHYFICADQGDLETSN
jgi:hypothetical protein